MKTFSQKPNWLFNTHMRMIVERWETGITNKPMLSPFFTTEDSWGALAGEELSTNLYVLDVITRHSYKSLSEPLFTELLFPCCVPMVAINDLWLWKKCLPLPINWIFFGCELSINVAGLVKTHWSVYYYESMLWGTTILRRRPILEGNDGWPTTFFYPMHEIWMHLLLVAH